MKLKLDLRTTRAIIGDRRRNKKMWNAVYSTSWFWYYAGPYVPSGVIYGMKEWPSHCHWLIPGFDPDPPIHKMDLYS